VRAVYHSDETWTPEIVLSIDDGRTLKRFEERSGIQRRLTARGHMVSPPTITEFFERQEWLPRDNPALLAVRQLLLDGRDAEPMTKPA
jgi:hypothetical protein